jgi:hypothetical protein
MNAKKTAAAAVLIVTLPVVVDVAADPYADRGLLRSWWYGARALAGALAVKWAADQFGAGR